MDSLQLMLLLMAVVSPLAAAGTIAALAGLPAKRLPLQLAKLGAAVSFFAAAIALVRLWGGFSQQDAATDLWVWTRGSRFDPLRIVLGLKSDVPAVALAAAMSLGTLCSLGWIRSRFPDRRSERLFYIGVSGLLFSCIGAAVSTGLGQLLVFWQLTGAAAYLMSSAHSDVTRHAAAVKKFVVTQRVGDLCLLFAVFGVAAGFQTLSFHALFNGQQAFARMAEPKLALVEFIGLCLLGACVSRCGLFPLIGWVEDLSTGPAPLAILIEAVCLMPLGVLLLIRCAPLFHVAAASSSLGAFVAAHAAFVTAACAWAAKEPRRTAGFACASVLAIAVCRLMLPGPEAERWAVVILCGTILTSAAVLEWFSRAGRESARGQSPGIAQVHREGRVAALAIGILFSGILGQGIILARAIEAIGSGDSRRINGFALPILLVLCAEFQLRWR